jgi:acetyl esterase/lipase
MPRSEGLETIATMLREAPLVDDVHERRANMDAFAATVVVPDDVRVDAVEANGVPAEVVVAPGADPDAWILYLHGGGYTTGSLGTHRGHVARLSRLCATQVVNVDYRLAPEHPFPAAVDDAVAAYRWLLDDRGVDPARVALAGDSAGGGLAAATLVALRDAGERLPAAAALISPWTDLTMTSATYDSRCDVDPMCSRSSLTPQAAMYLGGTDPTHPHASPLHADLRGLPPLLVHVGDHEVLLDDGVRFAERATAAGVDCTLEVTPEAIHVWHLFADFAPEGLDAMDRLASWLRPRLETDPSGRPRGSTSFWV